MAEYGINAIEVFRSRAAGRPNRWMDELELGEGGGWQWTFRPGLKTHLEPTNQGQMKVQADKLHFLSAADFFLSTSFILYSQMAFAQPVDKDPAWPSLVGPGGEESRSSRRGYRAV